jgi:hypothetical protein
MAYEKRLITMETTLKRLAYLATARGGQYQTEIYLNNSEWALSIRKKIGNYSTLRMCEDEHSQRCAYETAKLEIGHPLAIEVTWYDNVPEPPQL